MAQLCNMICLTAILFLLLGLNDLHMLEALFWPAVFALVVWVLARIIRWLLHRRVRNWWLLPVGLVVYALLTDSSLRETLFADTAKMFVWSALLFIVCGWCRSEPASEPQVRRRNG